MMLGLPSGADMGGFVRRVAFAARQVHWSWWAMFLGIGSAFLTVVVVAWLHAAPPHADYDGALREAARYRPEAVPLRSLPATEQVELINFTVDAKPGPQELKRPLWLALPDELRRRCAGLADPERALHRILGLPLRAPRRNVFTVKVPRAALIRPCVSGTSLETSACSDDFQPLPEAEISSLAGHLEALAAAVRAMGVPAEPAVQPSVAGPAELEQQLKAVTTQFGALSDHLRDLHFVAGHLWQSWRYGRPDPWAGRGYYPFGAVPFTGIGITHDWSNSANGALGVTEFVARVGTTVTFGRAMTAEEFCRGT